MAQHREVVDVMGNGASLDLQPAMGAGMHPAAVVGLHLQRVDKRIQPTGRLQMFDESRAINASGQLHNRFAIAESCGALQFSDQLWLVSLISDPAHLCALHRVPEPNAGGVLAPGVGVVGEPFRERPATDHLELNRIKPQKSPQVVVGLERFCGDRRSPAHQRVVGGVRTATERAECGDRHIGAGHDLKDDVTQASGTRPL